MVDTSTNGRVRALTPERIDIEQLTGEDVYTTARGYKLRILPVPPDLIVQAQERIPRPKPPEVPVIDQDTKKPIPGKFDQNYMDQGYVKQMEEYEHVVKQLTFQVMAGYGVVAYAVPPGLPGPDDPEWVQDLEDDDIFEVTTDQATYSGRVQVPGLDKPRARFAMWLRTTVLGSRDLDVLQDLFLRGAGFVLQKDVDHAVNSFPDND